MSNRKNGNRKNGMTPGEIEKAKTAKQKAADISYTFNHFLICTATDFIDPVVGNAIQKHLGNKSQLPNSYISEFMGDLCAVPVTIAVQRLFPGVMDRLRILAEPAFKDILLNGAERSAVDWAKRHNHSLDSREYKEKVQKIYKYEITHLPQAFVWTGAAIILNVTSQRLLGNKAPINHILVGKAGGALLTAAITLGGRSLFPYKAEKFDKFTREKIFLPVEDKISKILGADHPKMEDKHSSIWQKRIKSYNDDKSLKSL